MESSRQKETGKAKNDPENYLWGRLVKDGTDMGNGRERSNSENFMEKKEWLHYSQWIEKKTKKKYQRILEIKWTFKYILIISLPWKFMWFYRKRIQWNGKIIILIILLYCSFNTDSLKSGFRCCFASSPAIHLRSTKLL